MIRFDNITVKVASITLLDNICFQLQGGEKMVITGPSGSGKTTILNTLMGVHIPHSGEIFFKDKLMNHHSITHLRREVAYIGQEPYLGGANVEEGLLLPFSFRANRHKAPRRREIEEILDRLKLPQGILKKDEGIISGGEKQRIAIARALLLKKKIFLLDEITSALDRESIDVVNKIFNRQDFTLLSISHDPRWIDFCGRSIEIRKGKIVNMEEKNNGSH